MKSAQRPHPDAKLAASLHKNIAATLQSAGNNLDADTPEGALSRGKVFQYAGYYVEAVESYQAATASKRNADEATARLAIAHMLGRQPDEAVRVATELTKRNPGFEMKETTSSQRISAYTILGDALALSGRTDDAIRAYTRARTTSPKDAAAAGRLAQAHLAAGDTKKAIAAAPALAKNPRFARLASVLAAGGDNPDLLSRFGAGSLAGFVAVSVHGRPFIAGDGAVLADVAPDDAWCADV